MGATESHSSSTKQGLKRESNVLEWEETSYTKIPRGWSRVCRETASFFRFIGLGILVTVVQGAFQKNFVEPKKVTVYQSRVSSLLRALIHVLPMAFALLEIVVNLRGQFLGEFFTKQSYYQLAAKAHEITIDASLASIVLSYIRYELTGKGLPFGVFLGSLQFTSVSYLWSRELWSSLFTTGQCHKIRRTALIILILACGVIAATAGPASATLLIPRQLAWSVEPTYVLVNGTSQDIWPDRVDSSTVPNECSFVSASVSNGNPLCPGAIWQSIYDSIVENIATLTLDETLSKDSSVSGTVGGFTAPGGQFIYNMIGSCPTNQSSPQMCAVTEPLLVAEAAFNDSQSWLTQKGYASYYDIFHSVSQNLHAAYSAVTCLHDTIESPGDPSPILFPSVRRTKEQYSRSTEIIPHENTTKAEVYAASDASEYRLIWTDLPEELFGTIASGVIIAAPRSLIPASPQNITTCSLAVGWGTSSIKHDLELDELTISPIDVPASLKYLYKNDQTTLAPDFAFYGPFFANNSGYAYPQRPFRMPVEWLEYLNPISTFPDGTNNTVINAYMSVSSDRLSESDFAQLMTFMLSGGLPTIGLNLPWQTLPDGPIQCDDCEVFEVNHQYSGWAYDSTGIPVRLAIAVMIAYCTLALGHILYLGISGINSDSWDSAAEVVALAMNSSPTRYLKNTCSGVYGMRLFGTTVRIVATAQEAGGKEDHLELVFGEPEAKDSRTKLVIGEEYGSLPPGGHPN